MYVSNSDMKLNTILTPKSLPVPTYSPPNLFVKGAADSS